MRSACLGSRKALAGAGGCGLSQDRNQLLGLCIRQATEVRQPGAGGNFKEFVAESKTFVRECNGFDAAVV